IIKRILPVLAAAGLCAAASEPAFGQAWIGQVVGEMAAEQQQIQAEFDCRHAVPVAADSAKASMERIEKTWNAYAALSATSTAKDIAGVFSDEKALVSWKDGGQSVPLDQIAPHLGAMQDRKLVVAVMGGDNKTTRAIWSAQDAAGPIFYAVDFTNGTWLASARILHLEISHGATPPETPPAYCHLG